MSASFVSLGQSSNLPSIIFPVSSMSKYLNTPNLFMFGIGEYFTISVLTRLLFATMLALLMDSGLECCCFCFKLQVYNTNIVNLN